MTFDYRGARNEGYSDDEILSHVSQKHPKYDFQGAIKEGYSPEEIIRHLEKKKERGALQKTGRVGAQLGISLAENALMPYELGVLPLSSKAAQQVPYRENLFEDIERLQMQKDAGVWNEQDQQLYDHLLAQAKNPELSEQYIQTADLGVRGIAEKATGLDLHPEGILEKSAAWLGFLKNPKKIVEAGLNPKELYKAIAPTGKEALVSLGAGTALEIAEDGGYGPIGTLAAAAIGHSVGSLAAGAGKAIMSPKETLAKGIAKFTPKDKLIQQQEIIKDFRESGILADAGSLTDSQLVKWTQSRLAQSGLTGKALKDLREEITGQIEKEYKELADSLGEAKFAGTQEAGEIVKKGIEDIRNSELGEIRKIYSESREAVKEKAFVLPKKLYETVERIEKNLRPGSIKSAEQKVVIDKLQELKRDLFDSGGWPKAANVKALINNKIALNDIINYEVQGGTKQLLKEVVSELDRAIISHGKDNPSFAKKHILANKKFSEHAKTFRNKDIDSLLRSSDPSQILSKMDNVPYQRKLKKILQKSPEGKIIYDNLSRLKIDETFGKNLKDSATQQAKLGTFSKILEKGKNREAFKELLDPVAFKRLERLQKNSGKLAAAAQEFYNASKSGVVAADAAVIGKLLSDVGHLIMSNPWPLMKTTGGLVGARYLSYLLADPKFLKYVEEAILAAGKKSPKAMNLSIRSLMPYAKLGADQVQQQEEPNGS